MKTFESIQKLLKKMNVSFEEITFTDEAISARTKDTSLEGNYDPKSAIKTLIVSTESGFKAVILRGDDRIDQKKLKRHLGRWSIVDKETLVNKFGYKPGCICPLVLDLPFLIDKQALSLAKWSMGAGDQMKGINVETKDMLKYLPNHKVVSIALVDIPLSIKNTEPGLKNIDERLDLILRNTEEVLTKEGLVNILQNNQSLKHYIGFEISGKIHLGTGIVCMSKVKDFIEAGVDCSIFLADWHSWINDKLGGDRSVIKKIAVGYFKEGLRAAFKCVGGKPEKLKFVLGSDLYHNNDKYWETLIKVSKHTTLSRVKRSLDIMGRKAGEGVDFAKLIYPPMQVADIFIQHVNLAHAGMDQRKAHVIMKQVASKIQESKVKPIAIHHHLLLGLQKPPVWPVPKSNLRDVWISMKMSKSIPQSAIFIHDTPDEIKDKIKSAFCPPKETEFNPMLDWVKHLILTQDVSELIIKRPKKHGGNMVFRGFQELTDSYRKGVLHPEDLKNTVAEKIIELLRPAREHFQVPKMKKMLVEMETLTLTR